MENQDKIFKDAAGKAEDKGFARMDAVWNRVEEKLDNKKQRTIAAWWKYTGMAAVFLLFMGIGFFILTNEKNNSIVTPDSIPENNVTVVDTQKVKETFDPTKATEKEEVVTNETIKSLRQRSKTITSAATAPARSQATEELPMVESYAVAPRSEETVAVTPVSDPYGEVDKEKTTVETTAYVETSKPAITDKKQFTGVITDNQGMPLPGAKVIIEGTTKIATTDFDGNYMIDAKEGERLIATYVGMQSEKVTLGKRKDKVDFKLKDDITTLDEVVVMGYGTTSRKERRRAKKQEIASTSNTNTLGYLSTPSRTCRDGDTNSVGKTIKGRPNANFIKTLNGQVPGLEVTTGAGQPGANSTVVMRCFGSINGNPEPLYVVDGVPLGKESFSIINPDYIESVSVLKDAGATSIYGNRGINGVIIIKTKKEFSKKVKKDLKRFHKEQRKLLKKHPEQFQPVAPEPLE